MFQQIPNCEYSPRPVSSKLDAHARLVVGVILALFFCSTILVEPHCDAVITNSGDVQIQVDNEPSKYLYI